MKSIFIVPGLGEEMTNSRVDSLTRRWEDEQTKAFIFNSKWDSRETIDEKIQRLEDFYKENRAEDSRVVGYSAGGALANILFGLQPEIERIICISAKLAGSDTIGPAFQKRAPALLPAVAMSERTINNMKPKQKEKIYCMVPLFDEVVPKKDMKIAGSHVKTIPFAFHAPAIAFALIFQIRLLIK